MSDYPSIAAMKSAVELEIHAALGRVQTVVIGQMIQKAIDAETASLRDQINGAKFALLDITKHSLERYAIEVADSAVAALTIG